MSPYFLLLQLNDSIFPIGSYSHSFGLETYIQHNLITNSTEAGHYIHRWLELNFLYTDLLAARLSYELYRDGNTAEIETIEEIMEASRTPEEIRNAAEKLGRRFVKTVSGFSKDIIPGYFTWIESRNETQICHSVAYGAYTSATGIVERNALSNYLYSQSSLMITTCVKAIPISQSDGQKILFRLEKVFENILARVMLLDQDDLCMSVPGFDIRSMQHETLYSRLYMS